MHTYIHIIFIVNISSVRSVHHLQRSTVCEMPTSVLFHSECFLFLLPCIPFVTRSIYYRLPLIHP
jgi:hypothetical protein